MKKLTTVLIVVILLCFPMDGYSKVKVDKYGKEFSKKVELKKKEIKKRIKSKPLSYRNKPLQVMVTGAVIGKELHTSALGYKIKPGECAVSQDMVDMLGRTLVIGKGCGKYEKQKLAVVGKVKAACIMPKKWKNRIDVYVTSSAKAYSITGKRQLTIE